MQELYREIEIMMKHGVDHFRNELKSLRTGRATVAMLDGVKVDYYGSPVPINQVATLTAAEATLLVAQPFDNSQIGAIEKAIREANLGLNPSNDGKVVRIPVPPLTQERRKELVKRAHDMAEATRNSVRMARREGNDRLKTLEKEKEISQDDERRGQDEVQRLHDHYIKDTNDVLQHKEQQILEI
ncbi:MAG: ribosome recycling factor [Acidobacteriota bacterium]